MKPSATDILSRLSSVIREFVPDSATHEVRESVRLALSEALHDMDFVSREEFDAQKAVLHNLRRKIDELEAISAPQDADI